MEQEINFDFNEILKEFRSGKRLTGKDWTFSTTNKTTNRSCIRSRS